MYICICRAVTDAQIRKAVDAGADSLKDLAGCLGVATRCGSCRDHACALLRETRTARTACAMPSAEAA
jgi:bacterioferritin-associated ferredoxin